jgi:hypothetical protein
MTQHVELVFFEGCPHAEEARERMRTALLHLNRPAIWTEWDIGQDRTPDTFRRFASPAVLVGGVDVSGGGEGEGMACATDGGPTVDMILRALQRAGR